jgi:hypothetical protein
MIAKILSRTRKLRIPEGQKAQEFARELKKLGCSEVEVVDCDVCIELLFPQFRSLLKECVDLGKEEEIDFVEKRIPKEAKVRVHAQTPEGYLTYCFYCDSTMCGNRVEYPEDPNWDEIHLEMVREFLLAHPEWGVEKFMLSGSTRHTAFVDVVSPEEFFHKEKVKGVWIVVHSMGLLEGVSEKFENLPWIDKE